MKIAILGYGKQGQSAYEYWNDGVNEITICDAQILSAPKGVATNFESDYLNDLHDFDLIVRSPIIHPRDIMDSNSDHPEVMDKVTTVTNEFMKVCPTKNIIGVTGTKGKGTTSTLITRFLEAAGHRVHLGGNIGTPPLELLKNKIGQDDWVVLELANFQLIDLKQSPTIGVCLMVAPEHLDWHSDMLEYITAKQQLFIRQTPQDEAIYNSRNAYSEEIADVSPGRLVPYEVPPLEEEVIESNGAYVEGDHIYMRGKKVCHVDDVALLGRHNLENVCAAVAATWDIIAKTNEKPQAVIKSVIKVFGGLPHRLEILKPVNGVWFINDSFSSNPEATIAAIASIRHPQILIIGGFDRGIPLNDMVEAIKSSKDIKKVLVIGAAGQRIAQTLSGNGYKNFELLESTSLPEIVDHAMKLAKKGDAVVLSPGFASFDMFKNFEERGQQFKEIVSKL